jgi:transcriptional regulator with XRE-family HTH domain
MPAPLSELVLKLQEARTVKGWSQRELSERSGLTQAHISRIENGAVEPKLSTLLELSRLLDLELMLVPRQALTAVEAVLRDIEADIAGRPIRAIANMLARVARRLERASMRLPEAGPVAARASNLSAELAHFEPAIVQFPTTVAEMQRIAREIESAEDAENLERLSQGLRRLATLRNGFVHRRLDAQRPAYTLDDDED